MEEAIDRQPQPVMLTRSWAVARWIALIVACGAVAAAAFAVFIVTVQTLINS